MAKLARLNPLLRNACAIPFAAPASPSRWRNFSGWWSRRINREHRLVYRVTGKARHRRWKWRSAATIIEDGGEFPLAHDFCHAPVEDDHICAFISGFDAWSDNLEYNAIGILPASRSSELITSKSLFGGQHKTARTTAVLILETGIGSRRVPSHRGRTHLRGHPSCGKRQE